MTGSIALSVNGRRHMVEAAPETPLLYVLRDDLGLNGAKFGCGLGQCGACTVVVDGRAVLSCLLPVAALEGRAITTVEGLGTPERPGLLQQAFIAENAAQCGYCIAGMVMRAHALLDRNPDPTEAEIRAAMAGNLCRCGTHRRILAAIRRAASSRKGDRAGTPPPATGAGQGQGQGQGHGAAGATAGRVRS
ncbi:(2Fe-2S)-binding protein [Methylobacterium aerolatum]|uniref:Nicotinate dehydrogenase subunit A n=1 Tax=Methylobacterium aerolatum TaxID=418708 RepID=A0ABU0I5L7_9HYPH|nr:(2Fe-2S)-binding protein [Methylobacterium aerolatum]MDQ0449912.1 nicotinate dehydrogenase subunit A [Methylobacterium aerolatum]GJD37347.1 Nicotinate dehydrogenase subunit A [Methylobacterium aerolatum]